MSFIRSEIIHKPPGKVRMRQHLKNGLNVELTLDLTRIK